MSSASGAGGTSRQSAEALRQYLRTLTYEQLVAEFGPDGKRRVEARGDKKRVRETSPHLLKQPKHKVLPAAADSADAAGAGGDAH